MVEQYLAGDKDADMIFTILWARPGAWFSFFLQLLLFSFFLRFLLQWRLSWIFVTPSVVSGKEVYHPLPLMCNIKWPLVITLKVSGLLHQFRPSERLYKAISSQPTWGGYRTVYSFVALIVIVNQISPRIISYLHETTNNLCYDILLSSLLSILFPANHFSLITFISNICSQFTQD
jgi:hypothetical protein